MTAGIRVEGVSKHFGPIDALRPVDLEVTPGEVVTLLGPSGCGKTTLLRIVAGLEPSDRGDGDDRRRPTPAARAAKLIGFVPQTPALLPWRTVEANVAPARWRSTGAANPCPTARPRRPAAEVGLGDFLRPARTNSLAACSSASRSCGRSRSARRYLLMDEPFAALDEITRADMRHLLGRLCEQPGTAVLFVTHSIAEAVYLSDRVVVLSARPGHVVGVERIDLPRPRLPDIEDDPEFFAAETRVRHLLHEGAGR